MAELRYRDFSDVRALYSALEKLSDLEDSNGPLGPAVELVHHALRKRPFRVFVQAPPSALPLVQFITTEAGVGLTTALTTVSWMLSFSSLGDRSAFFRDDPSFWRNVSRWVNYMSLFNHDIRLTAMSHDQRDALFDSMDAVARFLSVVACALGPSLSKAIILSPENIIRTAVNAYFSSTHLYASGMHDPLHPSLAFECASILPFTLRIITSDGEMYPQVASEILRPVWGDPRQVYHVAAKHIAMLLERNIDDETAVHLDAQLVFIRIMALYPDLQPGPFPRRIIGALVTVMREHHAKDWMKEDGLSKVAYGVLADLCALDARTTVRALRKGVFDVLVCIRQNNPGCDIADLLHCIKASLVFRRAIRTFEQDILHLPTTPSLPLELRQVISLARDRQWARKLADRVWQRVAKCCNAQSTSPADAPLRACPCAEALYCSRSCQRYHWLEGGHRAACPRADNGTGASMSARDVHFISQLVSQYIEEEFSGIVKDDRCAYVSMVLDDCQPDVESLRLKDGGPQDPRIVVDVDVLYSGWRTLSLLIRPRKAQGRERFRLLTHGYSAQWEIFDN
ncbi:uncharacterized protein SCHCODRAFT_02578868 [Schizophyllum commune H4-8]|uniref:uncharacterized protein n=1 Tax=Schizophyllum commune (strain H4-8 / FGSC 9210) TaxID=578458 RepID=UPI00215E53B1|nr:uncharacterized protein SCHCODRAFT_02578868 [Schizophyllum commune H4-8]KAI5892511.1 hypothetical protein SCHCODRAFT_02578868 [Schizophyllum commune H4-8]